MQTICELDERNRFTGASLVIKDDEGCPLGWVFADLPGFTGPAQWGGAGWARVSAEAVLSARQSTLRLEIDARRDALLAAGFTPADGPLAGKTLQTRGADDKINWKLSRDAYKEAAEAGYGAARQATFRTAANETITLTVAEGLAVLTAMQAWGVAVLGRSWELKDAITAATDAAALDAIDIAAGWPT